MPDNLDVDEDLFARLSDDETITTLAGDRLYPSHVPAEETPTPWVMWLVTRTEPIQKLRGLSDRVKHTIELDCYAEGPAAYDVVRKLAAAVIDRLDGWVGDGVVQRCQWESTDTTPVSIEPPGYNSTVTFTVWALRSRLNRAGP